VGWHPIFLRETGSSDRACAPSQSAIQQIDNGRVFCLNQLRVLSTRKWPGRMPQSRIRRKRSDYMRVQALRPLIMESHIAARIAALHNIPFAICRTIIDAADRDLPPAAVIELRHDGTPDVLAILRSVMDQPNQIPALVRIATDAWTARKALRRGRRLLGGGLGCPYFDERASRTLDTAVPGTLPVGPSDANARYCARALPRSPSTSTDPHPALRPPQVRRAPLRPVRCGRFLDCPGEPPRSICQVDAQHTERESKWFAFKR
jgi:hypothetical protein